MELWIAMKLSSLKPKLPNIGNEALVPGCAELILSFPRGDSHRSRHRAPKWEASEWNGAQPSKKQLAKRPNSLRYRVLSRAKH